MCLSSKSGNAADGHKSTGGHGMVIFDFPQVDGSAIHALLMSEGHLLSEKGALLWVEPYFKA